MHPMLNMGIRAVRSAGDFIIQCMDRMQGIEVAEKSRNDFVSEVDRRAERIILDVLSKAYPDHAILAEESGAQGDSEYRWIIDPLDGTTNYLHGFPQFAISVALEHKGVLDQGIIYDPLRQELFTSSRGEGAWLNERRMRVSRRDSLEGALIGTGFPFRSLNRLDTYLDIFRQLTAVVAGIRRPGAASLDLAYVAAGRLDGFWEYGLEPWDIAAGTLLIREAGGFASDMDSGEPNIESGNIVAGNLAVHDMLMEIIRAAQDDRGRT